MLRRFLFSLVGLLGVGAALAQTPVTYSEAGREVVATIEGLDGPRVEKAIVSHKQCNPIFSFQWVPVVWTTTENVQYSGQWRDECTSEFVMDNVERFYEGYCETQNRSHCGRLKRGNLPWESETAATTGTSLDAWREFSVPPPQFAYPFQDSYEQGPGANPFEYTCSSQTATYKWSSFSYPHTAIPGDLVYVIMRGSDGDWSILTSSSPTPGTTATTALNNINSVCKATSSGIESPNIRDWFEGSYFNRAAGEVAPPAEPHADTVDGLRIIWAELLAENDRIAYPGLAIAGMRFDPLPTPEQLNQGEGNPGEGGGPGDLDPGTCEEGWFLTRVVCEIRELVSNTWQFVSHDAWVPQVNWGDRFDALRAEASSRFPMSVFNQNGLQFLDFNREQSEELACADIEVLVPNPFPGLGDPLVGGVNLCNNAFGNWMHTVGRGVLVIVMALLMTFSLVQRIAGGLSS